MSRFSVSFYLATILTRTVVAQIDQFQPCPILGPYVPTPRIDALSEVLQSALKDFTDLIDGYVAEADGLFGPITPNTTSFSMAIFAGEGYVPKEGDETPYFFEYHHTAGLLDDGSLTSNSAFALGDVTQMFTVLTTLTEWGSKAWQKSIVEFVPELLASSGIAGSIEHVNWREVTVGALTSHMAGIARDSDACQIYHACEAATFLEGLVAKPPVELPDSTPIFSMLHSSSWQLRSNLAVANLSPKSFTSPDTEVFGNGLSNASLVGEPASLGLVSSLTDLSKLGRAILTSELLSAAETRRWLKPVTSTSNLRNAVGRPFEIYHYSEEPVGDEITDIYTKSGTVGRYSSYFGVVPSADVGFAIVAVDTERENPDLNAYADIMLYALLQTQELAYQGANETLVGTYHGSGDSSLELQLTLNDTGIAVVELSANGSNFLEVIAREAGIDQLEDLDLRLYPTGLEEPQAGGGKSQAFEGTIQDKSALADAGTPTCITWQFVGLFELNGVAVDRFIVSFSESGVAEKITWPAGGLTFER